MDKNLISIDILKEYESNPRQIKDDEFQQLCENLIEYGFLDPLVVDQNNIVLGGNQRLRAALYLISQGYKDFKKVPVYRVETTDEQHRAKVNLLLNNHHGSYDMDSLAILLDDLSIEIGELDSLGFNNTDLDHLSYTIQTSDFQPQAESNTFDDIAERQRNKRIKCPYCGEEFNLND